MGIGKKDTHLVVIETLLKILMDSKAKRDEFGRFIPGDHQLEEISTEALNKIGEPVMEWLVNALQGDQSDIRDLALNALNIFEGDSSTVEPLIALLENQDADVRSASAKALSKNRALKNVKDSHVLPPLIKALKDEQIDVVSAAARAVAHLGDTNAIEPLIDAIYWKDDIALQAIWALGELGSGNQHAMEALVKSLQHEAPIVREFAASALGKIGDENVLEHLIIISNEENDKVQNKAKFAIAEIQKRNPSKNHRRNCKFEKTKEGN